VGRNRGDLGQVIIEALGDLVLAAVEAVAGVAVLVRHVDKKTSSIQLGVDFWSYVAYGVRGTADNVA
jgi:hypothetical protein